MARGSFISVYVLLAAACFTACSTDGGPGPDEVVNPQPIPVPAPDADRIFLGGAWSGGETLVAGVPAAVADADEVLIENMARGESRSAVVAVDGSFVMQIPWADGEALQCWARRGADEQSPRVELLLPQIGPPIPPSIPFTLDSVSPPDAAGAVMVAGTVDQPAIVVVANQDAGVAVTSFVAQAGSYELIVEGSAGDRLVVFGLDPGTRERLGLEEASVPGP